jgi:hypothetical protein
MTTLVTGASGFVGLNVVEHLLSRGSRVVALSHDRMPATTARDFVMLPGPAGDRCRGHHDAWRAGRGDARPRGARRHPSRGGDAERRRRPARHRARARRQCRRHRRDVRRRRRAQAAPRRLCELGRRLWRRGVPGSGRRAVRAAADDALRHHQAARASGWRRITARCTGSMSSRRGCRPCSVRGSATPVCALRSACPGSSPAWRCAARRPRSIRAGARLDLRPRHRARAGDAVVGAVASPRRLRRQPGRGLARRGASPRRWSRSSPPSAIASSSRASRPTSSSTRRSSAIAAASAASISLRSSASRCSSRPILPRRTTRAGCARTAPASRPRLVLAGDPR